MVSTLYIRNFAQIDHVEIPFADLTVLIGPQGSGKSIALQWFKMVKDGKQMVARLKEAGFETGPRTILDHVLGNGMGQGWKVGASGSEIKLNHSKTVLESIGKKGNGKESVYYIPAHRSTLLSDGWAASFHRLGSDTPMVARLFSDSLFQDFTGNKNSTLFPLNKKLKNIYKNKINDSIFHDGVIGLETDHLSRKRLQLAHGESKIPFMSWTAGQREFAPLLFGLYRIMPSTQIRKLKEVNYVVIEEPEMGLHPQAITTFFMLALELLWRGYMVAISTHSPTLVSAIWMLKHLQKFQADAQLLCNAFAAKKSDDFLKVAETALNAKISVTYLAYSKNGKVSSQDISELDAGSEVLGEAGWGGLTQYSSHFGEIVTQAAVNFENRNLKKSPSKTSGKFNAEKKAT